MRVRFLFSFCVVFAGCGSDDGAQIVCLDGAQTDSGECVVTPSGGLCVEAPNPSCSSVRTIEVSNPASDGPCLRIISDNGCGEVLYSTTCIQYDEGDGAEWQCWVSTALSGSEVDVGQCNATGVWRFWSGVSTGELDVVEGTCNPLAMVD